MFLNMAITGLIPEVLAEFLLKNHIHFFIKETQEIKYDSYNSCYLSKAEIAMSVLNDTRQGHFAKNYKIAQCVFSDQH